ncbi:MAG: hypothetical protein QOE14_83 [Humisphaera sp.]|nr:hypothetical protein [Humisphaera sp.]
MAKRKGAARRAGPASTAKVADTPAGFEIAAPPSRRLRTYAFDPTLGLRLETAVLNETTLKVRWEPQLQPGPVGEYLEVVDHDPATGCFYAPVDLNHKHVLAQDGLPPSEGNPQFHQQMVYAVAMTTIANFERALGRKALWAERKRDEKGRDIDSHDRRRYIPRLRIHPHALREANAYYSPDKKALLFGYFPAAKADEPGNLPGGIVFTCLSHDIIAHETTHALLDGLHPRFNEQSNPDVAAFHEAFADIVALFQHFTFPEAIVHQIAQTRGDLRRQNLLGALALQFGQALGSHGALRDAIGKFNENDQWVPHDPDPEEYEEATECHARGAILVAAVFDAFLAIYRHRVADLLRIATGGSGIVGEGELHPDLVNRLAAEATKSARHVLLMCIRALDYCPPVDITFGEYLRALITADLDLVPEDEHNYRIAFIEAFRRRGIYPRDVRTLSVDSLVWCGVTESDRLDLRLILPTSGELGSLMLDWDLDTDRRRIFEKSCNNRINVYNWIRELKGRAFVKGHDVAHAGKVVGLQLGRSYIPMEVHSVRPTRRTSLEGKHTVDWVIEITQRRPAWIDAEVQKANEAEYRRRPAGDPKRPKPDFYFRGGCTLIIDAESARVRYVIRKSIDSERRIERERAFRGSGQSLFATYFADPSTGRVKEPFALLHRSV